MNDLLYAPQQDILRQVLVDLKLGIRPGTGQGRWPVYVDQEPDEPDECLTLYQDQNTSAGRNMVDGEETEYFGVQIQVRCPSSKDGALYAHKIKLALDQLQVPYTVSLGGHSYKIYNCSPSGTVIPLGQDQTNQSRFLWTINYLLTLSRIS